MPHRLIFSTQWFLVGSGAHRLPDILHHCVIVRVRFFNQTFKQFWGRVDVNSYSVTICIHMLHIVFKNRCLYRKYTGQWSSNSPSQRFYQKAKNHLPGKNPDSINKQYSSYLQKFFTVISLTQSTITNIWVASRNFTKEWLHNFTQLYKRMTAQLHTTLQKNDCTTSHNFTKEWLHNF